MRALLPFLTSIVLVASPLAAQRKALPAPTTTCGATDLRIASSFFVGCFLWSGNSNAAGILNTLNASALFESGHL